MTKEQVEEIFDRVQTWPPDRQEDVIEVVKMMDAQDKSGLRLTDEQVAEVQRRLEEHDPRTLTLAEFSARLHRHYGV
jgi:transposase